MVCEYLLIRHEIRGEFRMNDELVDFKYRVRKAIFNTTLTVEEIENLIGVLEL